MPELKPCRALEHFSFDSYLPPSRTVIQFDIRSPSDYSYLTFSAIFHLTPSSAGIIQRSLLKKTVALAALDRLHIENPEQAEFFDKYDKPIECQMAGLRKA